MSDNTRTRGKWFWRAREWRERAKHWKRIAKSHKAEIDDLSDGEGETLTQAEKYRQQAKELRARLGRVQFLFQRAGFAGVDPKTGAPAVMVTPAKWNELGEAIAGGAKPDEIEAQSTK